MSKKSFGPNNLILGFTILAGLSTIMAWYLTLYIIDSGYGYEGNPFSFLIYDQPILALVRNLALTGIVGYLAYLYSRKTKFAYVPVLIVAYVFFTDYISDLTNLLLSFRLFG